MKYNRGDIVKMDGNNEPCIVYRVMGDHEEVLEFRFPDGKRDVNHTFIEVIGWVPTQFLRPISPNIEGNIFALDKALQQNAQLN